LIPAKSGIIYANQTGGHHCRENAVEGYLLPLFNTFGGINQEDILSKHFTGSKWYGWCGDGIDPETADFIDKVLGMTPYTSWLRVDRRRLRESHEAWVYVRPEQIQDTETIEFGGFTFRDGIIIWPNSD